MDHGIHLEAKYVTDFSGCHENVQMVSMHMKTALKGFDCEIAASNSLAQEHTLQLTFPKQFLCVYNTSCHQITGNLVGMSWKAPKQSFLNYIEL